MGHPTFFPFLGVLILLRLGLWVVLAILAAFARQVSEWAIAARGNTTIDASGQPVRQVLKGMTPSSTAAVTEVGGDQNP